MIRFIFCIIKGLFGSWIIDPIEVFYLVEENTFYPIISKSGCSSVKLALIKKYNNNFTCSFPEIHTINPAKLTSNKVERIYFPSFNQYLQFAKGKNICLIIKNPYKRCYSCYLGIIKKKNEMYDYNTRMRILIKITPTISFEKFFSLACSLPDFLSDRHFRSQSFFFSKKIQKVVNKSKIFTIEHFFSKNNELGNPYIKLNSNDTIITREKLLQLKRSQKFKRKYRADINLFEQFRK